MRAYRYSRVLCVRACGYSRVLCVRSCGYVLTCALRACVWVRTHVCFACVRVGTRVCFACVRMGPREGPLVTRDASYTRVFSTYLWAALYMYTEVTTLALRVAVTAAVRRMVYNFSLSCYILIMKLPQAYHWWNCANVTQERLSKCAFFNTVTPSAYILTFSRIIYSVCDACQSCVYYKELQYCTFTIMQFSDMHVNQPCRC